MSENAFTLKYYILFGLSDYTSFVVVGIAVLPEKLINKLRTQFYQSLK